MEFHFCVHFPKPSRQQSHPSSSSTRSADFVLLAVISESWIDGLSIRPAVALSRACVHRMLAHRCLHDAWVCSYDLCLRHLCDYCSTLLGHQHFGAGLVDGSLRQEEPGNRWLPDYLHRREQDRGVSLCQELPGGERC